MKRRMMIAASACCVSMMASAQVTCSIGSTEYATIQDAVNAVTTGDTVKITSDIQLSSTIDVSLTTPAFTMDLNGHVLSGKNIPEPTTSGEPASILYNSGNLTIIDSNPTATHTDSLASLQGGILTGGKGGYYVRSTGVQWGKPSGGAIFNNGNLTINGCTLYGNAAGRGSAMTNDTIGVAILNNCTICGNHSSDYGGGIVNYDGTFTMNDCNIYDNSATSVGGGIINVCGTMSLTNCNINGNVAPYCGGGIQNERGPITLDRCQICNNYSMSEEEGFGGGLYVGYSSATLTDCTFTGNTGLWGGAICVITYVDQLDMTRCTFSQNTAINEGGAVYCLGATAMTDCIVSNNTSYERGGGITCYDCILNMKNCDITDNTAAIQGGGFENFGNTTLEDCRITGNVSNGTWNGGGIYWWNEDNTASLDLKGKIIVKDNTTQGQPANVCLSGYTCAQVTLAGLTEGAEMGVSTELEDVEGAYQFTTNGTSDDLQYFTSDISSYEVVYDEAGFLKLQEASPNSIRTLGTSCSGTIYDLSGRRTNSLHKGLNIVDGAKRLY